jgi:hypothetical protein
VASARPDDTTRAREGFVLEHVRPIDRVARGDETLFTSADLGVTAGVILQAVPVGRAVFAWVYDPRTSRYVAVRWEEGVPARVLATSNDAAFAANERGIIVAQGARLVLQPLEGGAPRTLQSFARGAHITRAFVAGEDALVLVRTATDTDRGNVYKVGQAAPLARDVNWNETRVNGWIVQGHGPPFTIEANGRITDELAGAPANACVADVCVRVTRASAVVQIDALGHAHRLSPWSADREYTVEFSVRSNAYPPPPEHRLELVRATQTDAWMYRAANERPWSLVAEGTPQRLAPTPCASAVAIEPPHVVIETNRRFALYDDTNPSGRPLEVRALSDWTLDSSFVHTFLGGSSRGSHVMVPLHGTSLAGTRPFRVTTPDGSHTLDLDEYSFTLDGVEHGPSTGRSLLPPEQIFDGVFTVRGSPFAFLIAGRPSAHGGHFDYQQTLTLNLQSGEIRPAGPAGARPAGEHIRSNYGIFRSIAPSADGRRLLLRDAARVVLTSLDGAPTRQVYRGSSASLTLSVSADRERFAIVEDGRLYVGRYETGELTPVNLARAVERVVWSSGGHSLAARDANGVVFVGDRGARRLGCQGAAIELVDVLADTPAALVRMESSWRVAADGACHTTGEVSPTSETTWVPRGVRRFGRVEGCEREP